MNTPEHRASYTAEWEAAHRQAYAAGRKHWRPELATPPAFVEFMRSPWAPSTGQRILEAGCSDGLNAISLARTGYRVTGVDAAPSAIARAREAAAEAGVKVDFLCRDLVREPLPPPWDYDLWVDIKTLHCLWQDEDRHRYLATASAALRAAGGLFLNGALALADVREHFPAVFAALDAATRAQADILDRNLPPDQRRGIRCETLAWYCQELLQAGFSICDAKREASVERGWGVIIVAQRAAGPLPPELTHV